MDKNKAIESLKAIATKSKTANDFFHDCALRQRTRGQITIRGLELRMKREGFNHPPRRLRGRT